MKRDVPKFNDSVIKDIRKDEVEGMIEFIIDRYNECISVMDEDIQFIGYDILSPAETLKYELTANYKKNLINIRDDEAILVDFKFRYNDAEFVKKLYIPYIFENSSLIVNSVRYECLLRMTEKVFSVRKDNGITIKLIRSPISFWKSQLHAYKCVVSEMPFISSLVTCMLYYNKASKSKKRLKPTIVHYLLCKFPLPELLSMFGYQPDDAIYTKTIDDEENYYYFKIQNITLQRGPVLLKVKRSTMDTGEHTKLFRDIIGNISYILSTFRSVNLDNLVQTGTIYYRIFLGKINHNVNLDNVSALDYMNSHIKSIDTYLDSYSKKVFESNNLYVDDIYDLLGYILVNIDQIVMMHPNNDLYNKRLDTINGVIIDGLFRSLYYKIYKMDKRPNSTHMNENVLNSLNIIPRYILKHLSESENVRYNSSVYNDNWLLSIGMKVSKSLSSTTRRGSTKTSYSNEIALPKNIYHPSNMVVESAIGFSRAVSKNSVINPYAEVDQVQGFVKNDMALLADDLIKYLPK
jgi:hypothetical protein